MKYVGFIIEHAVHDDGYYLKYLKGYSDDFFNKLSIVLDNGGKYPNKLPLIPEICKKINP